MAKSFSFKNNDIRDENFGWGVAWGFWLCLLTFLIVLLFLDIR